MQGNKLYVQKRGEVYIVPVDEMSGMPIQITNVSDDLPGFPMTFNSYGELKAQFPRSEFVMLEPKQGSANKPSAPVPEEIKQQAAAYMKAHGIPTTPPTQNQRDVKLTTVGLAVESQRILEQTALGPKGRAEEFLKRLQTALEYASKKHEKKLQAQVEIIEALISEIF